jgi:hypothetical protein
MSAAAVEAPAVVESPFKGLSPYTEADAASFFGRDEEIEVVIANLEARRLTLVYGESGVGKSSLLRAGVVHRLREIASRNREEIGTPEIVPVYFAAWREDPLDALLHTVEEAVSDLVGGSAQETATSSHLDEALEHWSRQADADILIVFDQFEEYFLYHGLGRAGETFAEELPRAINNTRLHARFVVSIREDSLARLDRFKREIPTLFGTYIRIRHLTEQSATDAINGPIEEYYNSLRPATEHVTVEPAFTKEVLKQLSGGRVGFADAGVGLGANDEGRIEAPYLQVVMTRIWDEELRAGSRVLRRSTLDRLDGAERIIGTHLDEAMSDLTPAERGVAATVFNYLVTPTGAKIAHSPSDLAFYTSVPEETIRPVLERLSSPDIRILTPVSGPGGETRFQIFHDVLAAAILDWGERNRHGPVGRRRGILFAIVMSYVTFGVYAAYWLYQTLEEIRRHRRKGVGGVLPALSFFGLFAGWVMLASGGPTALSVVGGVILVPSLIGALFVSFWIPSIVGQMYREENLKAPVTGWSGFWLLIWLVWIARVQRALNRYWALYAGR